MATRNSAGGKSFSIDVDKCLADIRYKLADMEKKAPAVLANALNQSLTQLKKHIPQRVAEDFTYKNKLQVPKKPERASYKKLRIKLTYYPIPKEDLQKISYKSFDFKPGVPGTPRNTGGTQWEVKIRGDEGFQKKPRAFQVGETVFRRKGKERYPIFYALGPSEPTMVKTVWRSDKTREFTSAMLSKKLDEQINNQYLKKWRLK